MRAVTSDLHGTHRPCFSRQCAHGFNEHIFFLSNVHHTRAVCHDANLLTGDCRAGVQMCCWEKLKSASHWFIHSCTCANRHTLDILFKVHCFLGITGSLLYGVSGERTALSTGRMERHLLHSPLGIGFFRTIL